MKRWLGFFYPVGIVSKTKYYRLVVDLANLAEERTKGIESRLKKNRETAEARCLKRDGGLAVY